LVNILGNLMDEDWKIVEQSFWCRHKLAGRCLFHANPKHKCIKIKCPLEYNRYKKRKGRI